MKLILHIVRKDFRRMRWWLVAWAIVLVLPLLLGGIWASKMHGESDWKELANTSVALMVLQALVGYVIVLVLVQDDPVIGTQQAWATRPISPWRLLAAKAVAALLMVGGGAVVVALPWWIWCGFGAAEIAWAVLEYGLLSMIVIVPAMLMGALTDSLARAILWSLVLFCFVLVWTIPLSAGAVGAGRQSAVFVTRSILATSVWLVEAAVVIAMVYVSRRRGLAVIGAVAVMMFSWLACAWLPWELLVRHEPRELNPERGASVEMRFHEAWSEPMRSGRPLVPAVDHVRVSFGATAGETELQLHGMGARQTWSWPGVTFEREDRLARLGSRPAVLGFELPAADPETTAWVAAARRTEKKRNAPAGKSEIMNQRSRPPEDIWLEAYTLVPSSIAARMANESSNYEARFWFAWVRQSVRGEVALRTGDERRAKAHRMAIRHVEPGETMEIDLADYVAKPWIQEVVKGMRGRTWFAEREGGGYVVLNRERKEFRPISSVQRRAIYVHGVEIGIWQMNVAADRVRRGETFVDRPGWMEGASLAYVESKAESVFARDVRVEGFRARRVGNVEGGAR